MPASLFGSAAAHVELGARALDAETAGCYWDRDAARYAVTFRLASGATGETRVASSCPCCGRPVAAPERDHALSVVDVGGAPVVLLSCPVAAERGWALVLSSLSEGGR